MLQTPDNPLVEGWFNFTMSPSLSFPTQSILTFNFDLAIATLSSYTTKSIECYATGGLTYLTLCSIAGTTLTMQFGNYTNASVPIQILFYGLAKFSMPLYTTVGWSAILAYNSIAIATAASFPTLSTSNYMSTLYYNILTFRSNSQPDLNGLLS
jgi:hypothetical protein